MTYKCTNPNCGCRTHRRSYKIRDPPKYTPVEAHDRGYDGNIDNQEKVLEREYSEGAR